MHPHWGTAGDLSEKVGVTWKELPVSHPPPRAALSAFNGGPLTINKPMSLPRAKPLRCALDHIIQGVGKHGPHVKECPMPVTSFCLLSNSVHQQTHLLLFLPPQKQMLYSTPRLQGTWGCFISLLTFAAKFLPRVSSPPPPALLPSGFLRSSVLQKSMLNNK